MPDMLIRSARQEDVPAITALLNHYITHTTNNFILEPETIESRTAWLEQRSDAHPVVAAELDSVLAGWGALSPHNPRAGYRHSADVGVYVHPDYHRRGIGRAIVTELIARARAAGHHTLIALCCTESTASIALHESLGFVRVGYYREIGRKFDRWLDTVALQLML
ncbi:MAG TPA: GNAT family N-acetyltransferase [Chthoniobacterales bacterium]|nr:GNAT family N-acetyltransferase [Chthoniobacterales bacterium]